MTNEQLLELNDKIACGPGAEPILITGLKIGAGLKQDTVEIQLIGKATGTLINPKDPSEGENPLPEPLEVVYSVDFESADKTMFYNTLNRVFKIDPPLADLKNEEGDEVTLLRFEPDAEDSVYEKIVGEKKFFRLKVKQNNPNFPPIVNSTPILLRDREEIQAGSIKAKLEAIRAKKLKALDVF